ncbi:MAG: MFS transporter [Anaerolineaceae bacterium]|nr:MAG: MFS transporter [Anaerolineaceae bacterium]
MFKNKNLAILFFSLVVSMLGFGIIIPILPFYVDEFGGGGLEMGMLMTIFSTVQFVFSPIWGSLSDRIGRKPVLILGALGNALSMTLMGFATNYWILFSARALAGVLSSATMPAAMAFISDSTDEKQRGGGMGVVGAAFGVGMTLGPGIGGVMADISLQAPFFFAAGTSILAMVLIWIFLPETLPAEKRSETHRQVRGLDLRLMWRSLFGPIGFMLILAFLHNFALTNFEGIFGFYAQRRYNFDPPTIGLIMTVVGLISAIVQGILTGPATRRFGDENVIKASLFASVLGFLAMLAAPDLGWVLVTCGFFVLSNSMLRPGVASLTSKRADIPQGAAMGLSNAFMSLGRIVGPLWAGYVLDLDLHFPFLTGAIIMLIAGLASLHYLKPRVHTTAEPAITD